MNSYKHWLLLSLAVLPGCAETTEEPEDLPNAAVSQALTSFSFDLAPLAKRPSGLLPKTALTLDKLSETNITRSLLSTQEAPTRLTVEGTRTLYKTSSWEFERDAATGRVAAVSSALVGRPVALDPAALEKDAVTRLSTFGVGSEEVGRVLQRSVLAQDLDDGVPLGKPQVHSHKTFVYRAVGGIPVVGHRAVISHAADGSVRKVHMNWPALAKSGHALRTGLTDKDVQLRAADALARAGETTGKVSLYWRYLPQTNSAGETTLKLVAAAHVDGAMDTDGTTEESRIIDVDVGAVP